MKTALTLAAIAIVAYGVLKVLSWLEPKGGIDPEDYMGIG